MIDHSTEAQIHPKLKKNLLLSFLIFLTAAAIVLFEVYTHAEPISYAFIGLTLGTAIGIFTRRIYKLEWDAQTQQVASRVDIAGGIVLGLYLIFVINKGQLISLFAFGPAIAATSIAILAGVMLGRLISMRHHILKLLNNHSQ